MCGIAGILSSSVPPLERETAMRRMIARQRPRGPDDEGVVSDGDCSLGMCRLAIIDPANGHQPMTSPDGRYHLVFNGAIYNHRELRGEIAARGWDFRTECDTEVLLAALAQEGARCLPRLRGMFAFAFLDTRERRLLAARDPFGIKPLYYARLADGGLVFASELRALAASGLVATEIDPASAGEYLAWFGVPAPRTIYRGIAQLPPGQLLTVASDGRVAASRWWRLPEPNSPGRAANYAEFSGQLRAQLEGTIRAHRVADVPVGAFLSGGLDSTAIVALMTRTGATGLRTFSVVFPEAGYSEQEPARRAAAALGTEHHEELLTGRRLADELPQVLAAFDAPTGDGINTYYASLAARRGGVKVALSGLGGDELFGGYPSFRDLPRLAAFLPVWRRLPAAARRRGLAALRGRSSLRWQKLADFLEFGRDLHELAALQRRVLPEALRGALLAPEARAEAARLGPLHPMLDDFVPELAGADAMQVISAWELRTYMADTLLRDSDVFAMAHSLELRVPFIDRVFLEWLWPQAAWFRLREPGTKAALADATADLVPGFVRARRKQGFTLPLARWMRAELRPFLDATFAPASLGACPWLEAAAVRRLWEEFQTGRDPRAWSRVWTLAMLVHFANRRPGA